MNELVCEMCGSNDIVKQEGLYVCQSCGTKYSVEEAKKMMAGETVEVEGTVKIDNSTELANLYELARRARKKDDSEYALKYYEQILIKDPNSWEAELWVAYFKSNYSNRIYNIYKSLNSILKTIKNDIDEDKQKENILEVYEICNSMRSTYLFSPTKGFMYDLGDKIINTFGDEFSDVAVRFWIDGVNIHKKHVSRDDFDNDKHQIEEYSAKIQKYKPDFETPQIKKPPKCYVATSVYGSYDCPEVWTLRRFRDNTLDNNVFGRLFIKTYYATSPTIVKYFGDKKIFNMIFKPILDRFVKKLQDNGVESTYYDGN